MKKAAIALLTATALLAGPAVQAKQRMTGEEKLAKLLEGREAGEPVDCISFSRARDSRIIDKTAIVYGSGRTIYVNRPVNAEDLDDGDVMVTRTSLSRLCKLETVRLHDSSQFFFTGFVGLEKFVPYRKIAQKN
ncbi:MAG: hypothetical protein P8J20_06280 [Novosphingobium sp.]|nr:hypothetical protein [Novosphingobium sp.]